MDVVELRLLPANIRCGSWKTRGKKTGGFSWLKRRDEELEKENMN